jgi:hypothetical protein
VSDVTAIWNTNAFFAYVFTVKLFDLKWEARRLAAVVLATFGVLAVVYGGSVSSPAEDIGSKDIATMFRPKAPLVGDVLTLVASVGYGLYQVLYKKYAALPNDPELASEHDLYSQLSTSVPEEEEEGPILASEGDAVHPPPFGLHPNLLTSLIGLCTLLLLWIPLPFLHWMGIEPFMFPKDWTTIFMIVCIALSGVLYNAGFMVSCASLPNSHFLKQLQILIGAWGPIIASVGNLLTIVLVFLSDILFGGVVETITLWSVLGSGVIVAAFGLLAYDIATSGERGTAPEH